MHNVSIDALLQQIRKALTAAAGAAVADRKLSSRCRLRPTGSALLLLLLLLCLSCNLSAVEYNKLDASCNRLLSPITSSKA
jgi:hypothetical protein